MNIISRSRRFLNVIFLELEKFDESAKRYGKNFKRNNKLIMVDTTMCDQHVESVTNIKVHVDHKKYFFNIS